MSAKTNVSIDGFVNSTLVNSCSSTCLVATSTIPFTKEFFFRSVATIPHRKTAKDFFTIWWQHHKVIIVYLLFWMNLFKILYFVECNKCFGLLRPRFFVLFFRITIFRNLLSSELIAFDIQTFPCFFGFISIFLTEPT
jgi:hypothetical protein